MLPPPKPFLLLLLGPIPPPTGLNTIAVHVNSTVGSTVAALDLDIMYSASSPFTQVPDAVAGTPTAVAASSSSLAVAWKASPCAGSSLITAYQLQTTTAPVVTVTVPVTDPFKSSYAARVSGLAVCTTYTVKITAINAAGASLPKMATATTTCLVSHPPRAVV